MAAGAGSRIDSSVPKQFLLREGKPLYLHSLQPFLPLVSEAVVVVPRDWKETVQTELEGRFRSGKLVVVAGGAHRQDSSRKGLCRLSARVKTVLVHDAVRPFVSSGLIQRVIEGAGRFGACVPALPIGETVKEVEGERVVKTVDRDRLRLIQTPQGFEMDLLKKALHRSLRDRFYGTDEAVLVERLGSPVFVVGGDVTNVKITWPGDLNEPPTID